MRRGLGTLFVTTLAVTLFVSPNAVPLSPRSPAPSSQSLGHAPAHSKVPTPVPGRKPSAKLVHSPSSCALISKMPCQDCSQYCPARGLLDTIAAFFGPKAQREQDVASHWGVPQDARTNIRFVIATVPDPIHTHLSLLFDRQIDAIQEAVQQDDYLFARSYMPWDATEHSEDTDFRTRLAQEDYRSDRESYPGLMIFREANGPSDFSSRHFLFVFVVGETPTGGIDKSQYQSALEAIRAICGKDGCKTSRPSASKPSLFILGPTFSGSLYSLAILLRDGVKEIKEEFSDVFINTGTATDQRTIYWFTQVIRDHSPLGSLNVHFRAFQENSDYALIHFLDLACHYGYQPNDVAMLSEDETAYGSAYKDDNASTSHGEAGSPAGKSCIDRSRVLQLYFPRDIAQLRSAYQQSLQQQALANTSKSSSSSTLQLNLADAGNDDSVPAYSRAQTPLSQEAIMLGIVANLQKHHSRFVLLEATDSLDLLFLIRFLRVAYSEGRIITVDTDLLFPREVDDVHFQGVLEIASYPLIPGISDQTASAVPAKPQAGIHLDRVFPSNDSVGTFNALLALMTTQDAQERAVDSSTSKNQWVDLPPAAYAQYGWPNFAGPPPSGRSPLKPPLWLTVLGRGGYWPVALLDEHFSSDPLPVVPSSLDAISAQADGKPFVPPSIPNPWAVLCVLCLVIVGRFAYLLREGSIIQYSEARANFAPLNVPLRNWAIFVLDLAILVILLMLVWPWLTWACGFARGALVVLIVVFLLAWIIFAFSNLWKREAKKEARAFLFLSVIGCAACLLLTTWGPLSHHYFFAYRYIHVTSGVSPLVPWLLLDAAGLWWVWYTLAGSALMDNRRPRLPTRKQLVLTESEAQKTMKSKEALWYLGRKKPDRLSEVMSPLNRDWRIYVPAILLTLLPLAAMDIWHPVMSFERQSYDIIYALALGWVAFVVILGLFRLSVIWIEFRPLLIYLDRWPLRRGFERLKGFGWGPIWRVGGTALQDSYRIISREFESLDRLAILEHRDPRLSAAIEATRQNRQRVEIHLQDRLASEKTASNGSLWLTEPAWVCDVVSEFQGLQKQLAATCAASLKFLLLAWSDDPKLDLFESSPEDEEKGDGKGNTSKISTENIEVLLAEQFVCLFYLNFILSVLLRMRAIVMSAVGMFVFALLSFSSYPFEPKGSFDALMILLFLFLVGTVTVILAQMHRDPTLSRITNTPPGELGMAFWLRLASILAVPALGLLAAQFPAVGGFLFSWLQPALQALK
jgi:hypothetical protein